MIKIRIDFEGKYSPNGLLIPIYNNNNNNTENNKYLFQYFNWNIKYMQIYTYL